MIEKVVRERLFGDDVAPVRFFSGYGAETGPRWRRTVASLDAFRADQETDVMPAMIAGAQQTFGIFDRNIANALDEQS